MNATGRKRVGSQLALYFAAAALEALAALAYLFVIPADPKNSILFGFSLPRLLLVGALLVLGAGGVALAAQAWRDYRWAARVKAWVTSPHRWRFVGFAVAGSVLLGWLGVWTPAYRLQEFGPYLERLQPLLAWLLLVGLQSVYLWLAWRGGGWKTLREELAASRGALRYAGLALAGLLLLWLVIALTGLGLIPDTVHWNDTGVPLLAAPVTLAVLLGAVLLWLENKLKNWPARRLDGLLFALIWIAAAAAWVLQPLPRSFFAPGPYPPNGEYAPFSDAAVYDVTAQYALVGQELGDGLHVDKPLYSTLLVGLHLLAGQDYDPVMALQAALLAVLPALLYLLGKELHSRSAGVVVAVLALAHGMGLIEAVPYILTSNAKLMMSEVPLAVMLVLFTLLVVRWLKQPQQNGTALLLAGGVLGLSTLVRHNTWFLLPLVLLLAFVGGVGRWYKRLVGPVLLLVVLVVSIAPWMWRTDRVTHSPLYFMGPLQGVVWKQRYVPALESTATPASTASAGETAAGTTVPDGLVTPEAAAVQTAEPQAIASTGGLGKILGAVQFIAAHFFHNLVAMALILPTTLRYDDLVHTLQQPGSYWSADWLGQLSLGGGLLLLANLVWLAVGIGFAWKRWRLAGLTPLVMVLGYLAASAVARTSGGRYVVPVDWGVYLYFSLGLAQGITWLALLLGRHRAPESAAPVEAKSQPPAPAARAVGQGLLAALACLAIGVAVVLTDTAFPRRYTPLQSADFLAGAQSAALSQATGWDEAQLSQFLRQESAVVLSGRALYLRQYGIDVGEPDAYSYYRGMSFPRLVFTLIGPEGSSGVVLPLPQPPPAGSFPNGADVVVLGCRTPAYLDALAVLVQEDEGQWLLRSPQAPLQCPLPQPVCDDNHNCQ